MRNRPRPRAMRTSSSSSRNSLKMSCWNSYVVLSVSRGDRKELVFIKDMPAAQLTRYKSLLRLRQGRHSPINPPGYASLIA